MFPFFSFVSAKDASRGFVSDLVAKQNYSLSPSGRFLLMTGYSDGHSANLNPFKLKVTLASVNDQGINAIHDISYIGFTRVLWSLRQDRDELIGTKNNKLFRITGPATGATFSEYDLENITPWSDLEGISIIRWPRRANERLYLSATDTKTGRRGNYSCKIGSERRTCVLLENVDLNFGGYLFNNQGLIVARTHLDKNHVHITALDVPGKLVVNTQRNHRPFFSMSTSQDKFRAITDVDKVGNFLALSYGDSEHVSLIRFSLQSKQTAVHYATEYDIHDVLQNKYTDEVLAVAGFPDSQKIRFFNISLSRALDKLREEFGSPVRFELLSTDAANRSFVVRVRHTSIGFGTFLLHRDGGFFNIDKKIGKIGLEPQARRYAAPKPVRIPRKHGPALRGLLTVPTRNADPTPFVIMIHGGPSSHYRWTMHPLVQRLVSLGVAAFQLNYRGSSGYGRTYEEYIAIDGQPLRSVVEDVEAAFAWLVARGVGHPRMNGLWGDSFGATIALQTVARSGMPHRPMVLVSGMYDISEFIKVAVRGTFKQRAGIGIWNRYFGTSNEIQLLEKGTRVNPCALAAGVRGPVLIVAGAWDRVVHPDQSLALFDELRARGVGTKLRVLNDGQNHRINFPSNVVDVFSRSADFFRQHLGTEFQNHPKYKDSVNDTLNLKSQECLTRRRSLRDLLSKNRP